MRRIIEATLGVRHRERHLTNYPLRRKYAGNVIVALESDRGKGTVERDRRARRNPKGRKTRENRLYPKKKGSTCRHANIRLPIKKLRTPLGQEPLRCPGGSLNLLNVCRERSLSRERERKRERDSKKDCAIVIVPPFFFFFFSTSFNKYSDASCQRKGLREHPKEFTMNLPLPSTCYRFRCVLFFIIKGLLKILYSSNFPYCYSFIITIIIIIIIISSMRIYYEPPPFPLPSSLSMCFILQHQGIIKNIILK